MKISVIGAGSWGTAVSNLLAKKGYRVFLWARDKDLVEQIRKKRRNPRYLPKLKLSKEIEITNDFVEATKNSELIVFAVPSHVMREIVKKIKIYLNKKATLVSLTKGIEEESLMRMSEVIKDEIGNDFKGQIGVLSGPNHAEEVALEIPSATVVSSFKEETALFLQRVFMTSYFRVYTNPDIVGVELGGAFKNVIAIAAGISDGLGYGDNTKASLMTRGLAEMIRLGLKMGASPLTFIGLSGMGDLIVTCTSRYSRNRAVGEKLGKGLKLPQILSQMRMVAEGIKTSKAMEKLSLKYQIEMPITKNVVQVLYERKEPKECVSELMSREPTSEIKEIKFVKILKRED